MENSFSVNSQIINGVLGLILVEKDKIFDQKLILVQDYDDRGRGDGVKKFGLPGGGIEPNETHLQAITRELSEEISLQFKKCSLKEFGCYQKMRPNKTINDNYLFCSRLNYIPSLITCDPLEVSKVHVLKLKDIIDLATLDEVHEGSIRLIFHYFNGTKSGLLNEPTSFNGYEF